MFFEKVVQVMPVVSHYFKDLQKARKVVFEVMQETIQREAINTTIQRRSLLSIPTLYPWIKRDRSCFG